MGQRAHAIRGFRVPLPNSFHDASSLICDIANPIVLARRDDQMRVPSVHLAEQLVRFVDGELGRVFPGAGVAVSETFLAVDQGIGFGEQFVHLGFLDVVLWAGRGWT